MTISEFLDKNPSFEQIKDFVESEAARIVSELKTKRETGISLQEVET